MGYGGCKVTWSNYPFLVWIFAKRIKTNKFAKMWKGKNGQTKW
jgi:hypothetical protein